MKGRTVLIIDDSTYMGSKIKQIVQSQGFDVVGVAVNGELGIDYALELKPDIITLDNILPDMKGLDVLKVVKENLHHTRVIMISAVGQQSVINEAFDTGAEDYIVKPFEESKLIAVLKELQD